MKLTVKSINGNRNIELNAEIGKILEKREWSETEIHSSSVHTMAGEYVGERVSSSNIRNQEFWIRREDGSETKISLDDQPFNVREGHVVTLIFAKQIDKNHGDYIFAFNHTTKEYRDWLNKSPTKRASRLGSTTGIMNTVSCLSMLFMGLFTISIIGIPIVLAYVIYSTWSDGRKVKRWTAEVENWLNNVVKPIGDGQLQNKA